MHLITARIDGIPGAALAQQDPLDTQDPGTLLNDFFAENTWLTAVMAGTGVLLIISVILRTIWMSKEEGSNRALRSAMVRGLLALLLFFPSVVVDIAVLASQGVGAVAGWFFDTVTGSEQG